MSSTTVTPGPSSILGPTGQPLPYQPGEYTPPAPANLVTFGLQHVGPPTPLYIQRDDFLSFGVSSVFGTGETVTIVGRFLRAADGIVVPFEATVNLLNVVTERVGTLQLGEGYLLAISASALLSNQRGQTFVGVYLTRPSLSLFSPVQATQCLFADYITTQSVIGWPGGRITTPGEGPGCRYAIAVQNTGVSQQFSCTPSPLSNFLYRVAFVQATLTTSAVVANRVVSLELEPFVSTAKQATALNAQVASTAKTYTFARGVQASTDGNGNFVQPLPAEMAQTLYQGSGAVLTSNTTGFQTGDQWSAVTVLLELWAALV